MRRREGQTQGLEGNRRGSVWSHRLHDQQRRALTGHGDDAGALSRVPETGKKTRFYQHINASGFAFATDVAMLTVRRLSEKEGKPLGAVGDVLSSMYLASMVLEHYENPGRQEVDLPLVEWACRNLLYKAQEQLHTFLRNFPIASSPASCGYSFPHAARPITRRPIR